MEVHIFIVKPRGYNCIKGKKQLVSRSGIICSGDNVDKQQQTEKTSPNNNDDVYLENASIIAFLLVQQLLTINETSGSTLDIDGITITLEVNQETPTHQTEEKVPEILRDLVGINSLLYGGELCTIKFVNAVLPNNVHEQQQQMPFVVSLGKVLFTVIHLSRNSSQLGRYNIY